MAERQWYCMHGERKIGPLSSQQVRTAYAQGRIDLSSPLWSEGLAQWTPLGQCTAELGLDAVPDALGLPAHTTAPSPTAGIQQPEPLAWWDRLIRAVFIALAVGLAWGIRGTFGGITGAMFPGAILGLAYCYVSGQEVLLRRMPVIAFATAIGIGLGGEMSYGLLHGYAKADTLVNYSYGFLTLFLQGGSWGCFGCAMAGLLMERERATWIDWIGGIAVAIVSGVLVWWLVYKAIGFDINPVRTNNALGFLGAAIGIVPWLAVRRKFVAVRGALWGFAGFGLGMAGGRLAANMVYAMNPPYQINNWNIMELSAGAIGGLVFALGMLGIQAEDRESDGPMTRPETAAALFVMALIPLLHRISRVSEGRVAEWTANLERYGSTWTAATVGGTLTLLVICATAAAGAWLYLQYNERERWGWFPVLALSFIMLLFHHVAALYFFKPADPRYVDTQDWYWWIYGAMVLYVAVREFIGGHPDDTEPESRAERVPWISVPIVAVVGFVAIVFLAGYANGPETMTSAETRWPLWSYKDGPFPGRDVAE